MEIGASIVMCSSLLTCKLIAFSKLISKSESKIGVINNLFLVLPFTVTNFSEVSDEKSQLGRWAQNYRMVRRNCTLTLFWYKLTYKKIPMTFLGYRRWRPVTYIPVWDDCASLVHNHTWTGGGASGSPWVVPSLSILWLFSGLMPPLQGQQDIGWREWTSLSICLHRTVDLFLCFSVWLFSCPPSIKRDATFRRSIPRRWSIVQVFRLSI